MKALILNERRTVSLVDHPKPEASAPTDVVVRVVQTGICGTDRSVLVGKFPAEPGVVMGHEAVGFVDAVGSAVTAHKPGDRVVINPTLYCGSCPSCLRGHWDFCANKAGTEVGLDLDGAFAEFIRLPERFVHTLPEGMDFDRAVGVEPLACALNNIEAGRLEAGETAVIVGGGPVGVVCAMAARHHGARVLLIEPDPYRQELCRKVFAQDGDGRVTVHTPDEAEPARRGDVVIDTVGSLLEQSLGYAAARGRVVIMGYNSKATATVRPLEILQRGLQIIGAGDYNSQLFPKAIELARWLPLERLVTHRFPLERHEEAFAALAASPGTPYSALKVVLVPE
ncbi:zinc-dependent alcohol dehydrogenase [Streptomyces paromomycinus]|uniref:2-deoxy-scyllo-inosamine dehydrogenase n=1 Tax=Streptomyces paromomycinus TaxID=92743 RepID=A0A401VYU4_STREY|nr:alcohol dehydrogenase catalytic domain-containing protein [Streptomyces paromomycinus]GCD42253.1 alcohol dehydrogenase [Streptomyces paromomycinus]